MSNPDSRLIPQPEPSPDKPDIIWQVLELSFPKAANLYEAAELLITEVNSLYNSPSVSKKERWLFEPKKRGGFLSQKGKIPPDIAFMAFIGQDNHPTCLVYDDEFSRKVFSVDNMIIIPMEGTSEMIYTYYYAAKLAKPTDRIPPFPEEFVTGYLFKEKEGDNFALKSIYFRSSEAKQRYATAMTIRGFPTAVYDDIESLSRHTDDEYRKQRVERLIRKHGLPENIERQQLLEYNPSEKDL